MTAIPEFVRGFLDTLDTRHGAIRFVFPGVDPITIGLGDFVGEVQVRSWNGLQRIIEADDQSIGFADAFALGEIELLGNTTAILWTLYISGGWETSPFKKIAEKSIRTSATLRYQDAVTSYDDQERIYDVFLDGRTRSYSAAVFDSDMTAIDAAREQALQSACSNPPTQHGTYERLMTAWLAQNRLSDELRLDEAQERKLRRTVDKALLRFSQNGFHSQWIKVLDLGCGWGGLDHVLLEDSRVRVHAVTVSSTQAEFIRESCNDDRLVVSVSDYASVGMAHAFDAIVSIGMIEHMGQHGLNELCAYTRSRLSENGVGVFQTIIRTDETRMNPFIERYIFPGSYFHTLPAIVGAFERAGLAVRDVETWDRQYAYTLQIWESNWLRRRELALAALGRDHESRQRGPSQDPDALFRLWLFYFMGARASFLCGNTRSAQIVVTPPSNVVSLPLLPVSRW